MPNLKPVQNNLFNVNAYLQAFLIWTNIHGLFSIWVKREAGEAEAEGGEERGGPLKEQ